MRRTRRAPFIMALLGGLVVGVLGSSLLFKANAHLLGGGARAEGRLESKAASKRDESVEHSDGSPSEPQLTLRQLRDVLTDSPSRMNRVELWILSEKLDYGRLHELYLRASGLKGDWQAAEIASVLLERMAHVDPKAVWALYQLMGASERDAFPLDQFLHVLARADLGAAKDLVSKLAIGKQAEAYALLARSLGDRSPERALEFLEALSDPDLVSGLSDLDLLGRLGSHDPVGTAKLMERMPMNWKAVEKFSRFAEVWAAKDPVKALEWFGEIEFEPVRQRTLESLYRSWVKSDRGAAFRALGETGNDAHRLRLFGGMAQEVIREDPGQAAVWVRGLEGEQRAYALGLLGSEIAANDPKRAAEILGEAIEVGGAPLAQPSDGIGFAFASQDADAATEWVKGIGDETVQEHAAAGVTRALASIDPVSAAEWISTLPAGGVQNRSIGHLIESIREADPEQAFNWGSSVQGDPERRFHFLSRAVDAWKAVSHRDTREAIRGLEISDDEKERLLSRVW